MRAYARIDEVSLCVSDNPTIGARMESPATRVFGTSERPAIKISRKPYFNSLERIMTADYDVIVVGAGNAALCAALSAREQGRSVLILERAPFDHRGGNSAYTL